MKVNLSFKTPDVADQLEPEEKKAMEKWLKKHVEYDEYLYVEIDTKTGRSTILDV